METVLYQKLFARMDELGAIRKDLTTGCEITTCECNDGCCGIEEGVIGEQYGKCNGQKTSYIGAKFEINVMEVKGHPPILSDCMSALYARLQLFDTYEQEQNCDRLLESFPYNYDYSKPYLHQQLDELGEKLLKLLS